MKPRRLSLDTKKLEQPGDTYPYGKNGIWNANIGAEQNENGFVPSGITIPYKVIGIIETDTFPVYFSTDNVNSAFGFHDVYKDIYVPIFDDSALDFKLKFNINRPIKGEYRRNFRNEIELVWLELATTGANPPRWANTVTLGTNPNDFLLFPQYEIPNIDTQVQPGGNLGMGAYFFGLQYGRADGTITRYTTLTSPLIATSDNYSTIPGTNTGKAITLNITNLDQTYDWVSLVVVERINGVDTPYTLPQLPIAPNITFIYTGAEKQTQLTMEEVLIPAAFYENAYAITQMNDQLFLANMVEETVIDWQQYASMVKVRWKSEVTNVASRPNLPVESGKQRGWMHQEVAALYMVLKLKSGRNSRAFTIVGPAPISADLLQSSVATAQSLTAKVYQIEDTCRNIDTVTKTGDCGIWVNQNEVYPDIPQFDSSAIGGENLRGQPVRHHRLPSIEFCKQNLYGSNADYGRTQLDTLGFEVSNVIIPANLQDQVIGWELHYAKRDYNNALVLGQSLLMFGAQANGDAAGGGGITSTGGNWSSYQRTRSHGAIGDPESLRLTNNYFRFHALDLLFNRPSINPSYLSIQLYYVIRFGGSNNIAFNSPNQVLFDLDYTNGQSNVDAPRTPGINTVYKISNGQYIPNNGSSGDFFNVRLEDAYVGKINAPDPDLMSTLGWTWMKRDYTNGLNIQPLFETTYLTNLMMLRSNVYLNYFSQTLVRTGVVFPSTIQASTSTIYGGDTFLSEYNFITYGLVTKKDIIADTGIQDWKTADTDGIKTNHLFICETVADGAARYQIPGNMYSEFWPQSSMAGGLSAFLIPFSRNNTPNQIGYTRDCNAVGDLLNGILIATPYDQFVQVSPNKIVRSVQQISESVINSWKNFNALDFYEDIKNKGPIINLCGMNDRLIIHHQHGLFITRSKATFNTDITQVTLGTGDIFQFQPNEVRPAHLGYGGTLNPLACTLTPIGYMYPDNITGELLLFDGTNLENIGVGMINFLLKYMTIKEINNYIGNGIIIGYEQFYKRILLTVKNVSLSSNSLVFVPGFANTPEFFATLTANVSVVYKDGRYQLFKGVNSSMYECDDTLFPTLPDTEFTSDEHVPNGTVIGTVTATGGVGPYTYLITTVDKAGLTMDPLTGIIIVSDSGAFDYTRSVLVLAIQVTDSNENSATGTSSITINQVDSVPVLPAYNVSLTEHSPNSTVVNTEVATDRDGKSIVYSITGGNGLGGFAINATTGVVTVVTTGVLDYFTNPNFVLTIRATTPSTGAFAENTLTINLTFVHQAPTASNDAFNIDASSVNGTIVGTVTPATQRAGQTGTLIYELVSDSTPAGAFEVITDPLDPDFLKVKVLDNTLLSTADDDYVITMSVFDPAYPSDSVNFTITNHVFATGTVNYNQTQQSTPYVDINGQIKLDGVDIKDFYFTESGTVALSGIVVEFQAACIDPPSGTSPTISMVITRTVGGVVTTVFSSSIAATPGALLDYSENIVPGAVYGMVNVSHSTVEEFSSVRKSGLFVKDCSGTPGTSGTTVEYVVIAGAYTSSVDQATADAAAQADVDANGQAYANSHGSCLVEASMSTLLVDYENDTDANLCAYVKTTGLDESGVLVTGTTMGGPLMRPNDGRDPSTAWFLSSDKLASTSPAWRFGFNLAYFISKYTGVLTTIDLEIRGRSLTAALVTGSYAARDITEGVLELTGSTGSKIPAVTMGSSVPVGYSTNITSGADGTVGLTVGLPILTLTYNFTTNTLSATTY